MTHKIARLAPSALLLAVVVAGCGVDNHASVQLKEICAFTADCKFEATCGVGNGLGVAEVDLATTNANPSPASLLLPIEIDNNLADNANASSGKLNTNDAYIERFDMSYAVGGTVVTTASANQTFVVPTTGSLVAGVFVIPRSAGTTMAGLVPKDGTKVEVTVTLTAHGHLGDGHDFDTAPMKIPVLVSNNNVPIDVFCETGKTAADFCPQPGQTNAHTCN